jgi:cytochrome c biogenesis protein CcdA
MEAVLEELHKEVGDKYEIVVVSIDKYPAAAREYDIKAIPQQIYFNADGEEVYRPDPGFYPKEKVLEILKTVEEKGTYEGEATFTYRVKRMVAGGSWLAVILVFCMGLLTASNPCVLATIPLLVGFIGGYRGASGWKRSFVFSLFFVLGLSVMFMVLGIIAGLTGSLMGQVGDFWTYLVVAVCVVMGLHLLGILEFNIPAPKSIKPGQRGIISSFSFGVLFGIISTPCAVPIVAVLMVLIATQGSIFYAAVMLLVYSLGHGTLLLVAGTSMGAAKKIIESRNLTTATNALRKLAAALIIAVGLYFLYR